MRLTRQTDYSFRVLMFCATGGERLSRVSDIARAYGVSEPFVFKLLQPLVEAGIVDTVRGRSGGIRLARPAAEITLAQVVRVTEDHLMLAECFEDAETDCPLVATCQLSTALSEALSAFMGVLERYTIDDLSKPSAAVIHLLGQLDSKPNA